MAYSKLYLMQSSPQKPHFSIYLRRQQKVGWKNTLILVYLVACNGLIQRYKLGGCLNVIFVSFLLLLLLFYSIKVKIFGMVSKKDVLHIMRFGAAAAPLSHILQLGICVLLVYIMVVQNKYVNGTKGSSAAHIHMLTKSKYKPKTKFK